MWGGGQRQETVYTPDLHSNFGIDRRGRNEAFHAASHIMQPIVLRLETQGGAVELELHIKGLPEETLSPRCPGDDSWEQQLQDQGKRRATLTTILRGVGRPRPSRQLRLLTTRCRDRFDASGRAGQARQARAFCRRVAGAAVWQVGRAQVRFAIGWWVRSGATPQIRCSELLTPSQIAAA